MKKRNLVLLTGASALLGIGSYLALGPIKEERIRNWSEEQIQVYGTIENPAFTLEIEPAQPAIFAEIERVFSNPAQGKNLEQIIRENPTFADFKDEVFAQVVHDETGADYRAIRGTLMNNSVPDGTIAKFKQYFTEITGRNIPLDESDRAGIKFTERGEVQWVYNTHFNLKREIPEGSFPQTIRGIIMMTSELGRIPPQHMSHLIKEEIYDPYEGPSNVRIAEVESVLKKVNIKVNIPKSQKNPYEINYAWDLDNKAAYAFVEAMLRRFYEDNPKAAIRAKAAFENDIRGEHRYPLQGIDPDASYIDKRKEMTLRETARHFSTKPLIKQ